MFTVSQRERFREIAERTLDCRTRVRKYELMSRTEQDRDDLYDLLTEAMKDAAQLADQLADAERR